MVHVTSLRNDYYYFDPIHHRLVGERSGIEYKLGGSVKVKVIRVDIDDRKIDFELLESEATGKKQKRSRSEKGGNHKPGVEKNSKNKKNKSKSRSHKNNTKKRAD